MKEVLTTLWYAFIITLTFKLSVTVISLVKSGVSITPPDHLKDYTFILRLLVTGQIIFFAALFYGFIYLTNKLFNQLYAQKP